MKNHRIAIIVGHDSDAMGATSYDGELTEYEINLQVGVAVQVLLQERNMNAMCFVKQGADYDRIKDFMPSVTVELHCNAYDGKTPCHGVEVLINNEASRPFAENIALNLGQQFGFKIRGQKGVKTVVSGCRGYSRLLPSLLGLRAENRVIVEPTFIDVKTVEAENFLRSLPRYSEVLSDIIYDYFK